MSHDTGLGNGAARGKPGVRVFRFAPSPNGLLHLGHAYSALMNQAIAANCDGTLLLRLENIDRHRCTPAFETAIAEDLDWLGFRWRPPIMRQSERMGAYHSALDSLRVRGFAYPCFCTRGDLARWTMDRPGWPRDPDGSPLYPGTCRNLPDAERRRRIAAGEASALRLDFAQARAAVREPLRWEEYHESENATVVQAQPDVWGDALLARKDIATSYHIAVVTDDAKQGVTDVVRGSDLYEATSLHRLLQALLEIPTPGYRHHRLIQDAAGMKLAKSKGAPPLRAMKRAGTTPSAIRAMLGFPHASPIAGAATTQPA